MLEVLELISVVGGLLRSPLLGILPQGILEDLGEDSSLSPSGDVRWRTPDGQLFHQSEDQISAAGSTSGLHLQIFAPQTLAGRGGHVCIRPRSPLGRTWFFY